ncbi:UV-B-induced protein At3g17800, chloroplastic-like [Lolium rigidum]|uniref:UV-B-induced protein At3g17800, chloroplastic-like n=1 Tax=Lolium rigidum TaxID=89674 RepID=UPI001F5DF387|nr:UV-B-induced protein At3g17800, chloroplastic-like [Lolium rigidum]
MAALRPGPRAAIGDIRSAAVCRGSCRPSYLPSRSWQQGYVLNRKSKCISKKLLTTITGAKPDESEFDSVDAPLEPQTWEGSFLCGLLKSQPHIFLVAAAKQLQQMCIERKDTLTRWEHSIGSSEDCLHRRIAKMKEHECRTAIEDVMYVLIVHKYFKIEVPMVPNLSKLISNRRLRIWPPREADLESIHGPEELGLIREHLTNIIRWVHRNGPKINLSTLRVKRLQLGRIYSASVMYGYFLKSVTVRHRLELTLARPHEFLQPIQFLNAQLATTQKQEEKEAVCSSAQSLSSSKPSSVVDLHDLKSYIMGFDPKTLELCAKLRSSEASNLIEKHSQALFGENVGSTENDEAVILDPASLKRLLLEAIAFGSFLWDVEDYVDEIFKFQDS